MEPENILYASVQLAHNFGAAAVTGLAIADLWFTPAAGRDEKVASCHLDHQVVRSLLIPEPSRAA
jgi:hypothetical protein